jgi:hypothetical protein
MPTDGVAVYGKGPTPIADSLEASRRAGRLLGVPNNRPAVDGWHSEELAARKLGETLPTRRRKRRQGIGPKSIIMGRHVLYRDGAEEKYLAELEAEAEASRKPRGRGRPRGTR